MLQLALTTLVLLLSFLAVPTSAWAYTCVSNGNYCVPQGETCNPGDQYGSGGTCAPGRVCCKRAAVPTCYCTGYSYGGCNSCGSQNQKTITCASIGPNGCKGGDWVGEFMGCTTDLSCTSCTSCSSYTAVGNCGPSGGCPEGQKKFQCNNPGPAGCSGGVSGTQCRDDSSCKYCDAWHQNTANCPGGCNPDSNGGTCVSYCSSTKCPNGCSSSNTSGGVCKYVCTLDTCFEQCGQTPCQSDQDKVTCNYKDSAGNPGPNQYCVLPGGATTNYTCVNNTNCGSGLCHSYGWIVDPSTVYCGTYGAKDTCYGKAYDCQQCGSKTPGPSDSICAGNPSGSCAKISGLEIGTQCLIAGQTCTPTVGGVGTTSSRCTGGPVCGDLICNGSETCATCPGDCTTGCGGPGGTPPPPPPPPPPPGTTGWWQVCGSAISTTDMVSALPNGQKLVSCTDGGVAAYGGALNTNSQPSGSTADINYSVSKAFTANNSYSEFKRRVTNKVTPNPFAGSSLTPGVPAADGFIYWQATGTVTLPAQNIGTNKVVLLSDGDVNITGNLTFTDGQGLLVILSGGNITLDGSVATLKGIYLAQGTFDTGVSANQLQVDGTVVGLTDVVLSRTYTAGSQPAEIFIYRPEYVDMLPPALLRRNILKQEVAP